MAWRVSNVIDQRKEFINEFLRNEFSLADLCRRFEISRKCGYKWIQRFQEEGYDGLKDRSRAPHHIPGETSEDMVRKILEVKNFYRKWGPKKIYAFFQNNGDYEDLPSTTTIGKILDKNGLVIPRKTRRRLPSKTDPLSHCTKPNDVWCVDFKGWFKTKEGIKCDPLTVTDAYSRFLLYCRKLPLNTVEYVWDALKKSFCENGLPLYLRHDNGPPFATCGAGRLSRLSVKLIKAGVIPEWIDPGKPQQNGRHERMHLTLKQECVLPGKLTLKEQQMRFKEFQQYFNFERPHEALNQKPPGSVYVPSDRIWRGKFRAPEYTENCIVIRVRDRGQIAWKSSDIYIGKALKGENIAVKESKTGELMVYFGPVLLGYIENDENFTFPKINNRKKGKYKIRFY